MAFKKRKTLMLSWPLVIKIFFYGFVLQTVIWAHLVFYFFYFFILSFIHTHTYIYIYMTYKTLVFNYSFLLLSNVNACIYTDIHVTLPKWKRYRVCKIIISRHEAIYYIINFFYKEKYFFGVPHPLWSDLRS